MLDCASWLTGLGCGMLIGWLLKRSSRSAISTVTAVNKAARFSPATVIGDARGEYKLILVVRNDLKMGKGKIAAQCSHATLAAYKKAASRTAGGELLRLWENQGQAKVVVKIENERAMSELQRAARDAGLSTSVIQDAGRTQISPGSVTVMSVGPAPASLLDPVTGHLKLM